VHCTATACVLLTYVALRYSGGADVCASMH
jgi:hypothetical protein